jgi:hypothetical protein
VLLVLIAEFPGLVAVRLARMRFRAIVLAAALSAFSVSTASAASPLTWGVPRPVDTAHGLGAVACPTSSLCVAGGALRTIGGTTEYIATSTNPAANTWSVGPVTVGGGANGVATSITSISCSGPKLCVAVDDRGHILSSSNPAGGSATWTSRYFEDPSAHQSRGLSSVSCTGSLCVATDSGNNAVLTSNSPAGGTWTATPTPVTWGAVSCFGGNGCVAASGISVFYTNDPGGGIDKWTEAKLVPFNGSTYNGALGAISCTPDLCVVTDDGSPTLATGTWSTTHPASGASGWTRIDNSPVTGMSCVSSRTNLCAGWSQFGAFVTASTNPTGMSSDWIAVNHVSGPADPHIAGVSCASPALCVAVTTSGLAVIGTSFGLVPAPSHTKITTAKINAAKHTASFSFTARSASGFQCELIAPTKKGHKKPKPKFSSCRSPAAYKHLKAGEYTFLVRGANHTGTDPSPARKTFTIK